MAIADFVQGSPQTFDYVPGSAVPAGTVVVVGTEVRIHHLGINANELGSVACGGGVYDIDKDASTFADGAIVYWDDTAKKATSTVGSNKKIGTSKGAAATGANKVRVQHIPNNV